MHDQPPSEPQRDARIFLVDDDPANLALLRAVLERDGYQGLEHFESPAALLARFDEVAPDLVITDLHMPDFDGLELLDALRERIVADDFLPVLMITASQSADAERDALSRGVNDFIHKPFRSHQIRLRVRNLLHTRRLHLALREHNRTLEERVRERTAELEAARLDILERLALAAEYRDHTTGRHTQRVGVLSALIAERLGLSEEEVDLIRRAAPLHDVGKIGVPDTVLLKPGRLSPYEFEVMKGHIQVGVDLLSHGKSDLIQLAEQIALTHHERWDGTGYPRGLRGDEIPLVGQIVSVADVFDTLVNERPYKQAWPVERAVAELRRQSGTMFNPLVVRVLLEVLAERADLLEEIEAQAREGSTVRQTLF